MLKYINIPVFLAAFAFGMFAVYITSPDTRKIIIYPSPDNVNVIQYKDRANNCFAFKQTSMKCSGDVKTTPVQVK